MVNKSFFTFLGRSSFLVFALSVTTEARVRWGEEVPGPSYYSQFVELPETGGLTAPFCAEWNPDYPYRGGQCCAKVPRRGSNTGGFCPAARAKSSFCDEMTLEQKIYVQQVAAAPEFDVLKLISKEAGRNGPQAWCSPNNGFLVWGRPLVPTAANRIALRRPDRCSNFGTDQMVGMLEWVGRKVASEYHAKEFEGVRLLIGDISAPKGGCLKGRGGKRGHSSHMAGQDADVGFLNAKENARSPAEFDKKRFDPVQNWWLIKQIFQNPFACVKVIFLDRKHIGKLRSIAKPEEWDQYKAFIRHVKNHKNHMHVRIGDRPGEPGCHSAEVEDADDVDVEEEEG